ncbi:MAG TPA: helix-turn-helix transcriptional regulator [Actinospica sp.]|jgi:AraC-like DNA-binding protein|nr:helix-turn-helix transcriptional regulator [Actinospica sp.]
MSGIGHDLAVATYRLRDGARFVRHAHHDHQLLWASSGVLSVETETAGWVLPSTRALWIPAGLPHETSSSSPTATIRSMHVRRHAARVAWTAPTPIAARPLLAELIGYLEDEDLTADRRRRAEGVLLDLIEPAPTAAIEPRMPKSAAALRVAEGIVRDPADRRSLEEWGRAVGASGRTLARAFAAETGVSFGRWRTLARLRAALPALADGVAVSRVAGRVGYESASAFVAAFRRETGLTPAAYFKACAED